MMGFKSTATTLQFKHYPMKAFLSAIFLFIAFASHAQELQKYYSDAMAAYKVKDFPRFYEEIKKANKIHPYHQGVLYQLGIAATLTGKKPEAIQNLKKAILINTDFKLEGIADFNSIKDSPEFKKLLALQKEWQTRVVHSETAFTLKDRSLHTEGIEYDATHKMFYLGSIHKRKIIKVTPDGKATDYCSSAFEGMASIFGIKVDAKRNFLWACASPMEEMENYDSLARSAIFQFELSSGKLLRKYPMLLNKNNCVFGDLILSKEGRVFISDSKNNDIYTINEKTRQIEPYYSSPEFWNMQGMAFSSDEKYLFIADYVKGIYRLNMKTRELTEIKNNAEVSTSAVALKGIDGIYFYNNSLIAIQNGVNPLRSTRYFLNKELNEIVGFEIIDRKHPSFGEPTLGVIDGKDFYYIANSQWDGYDDNHKIKPDDQLQDIVILKYQLK
jgi:sugar lactone lactonase YvrE